MVEILHDPQKWLVARVGERPFSRDRQVESPVSG
jgi:hypothetical protein